jgi:hypothetical protein
LKVQDADGWIEIGMDLEGTGYGDVDYIAQDRNKWMAAVNTVKIFRVL